MPPTSLTNQIIQFLLTLNLSSVESREALLQHAGFDQALVNSIDCSQRPTDFAANCVRAAIDYGTLESHRDAIDALLEGAGHLGGYEKQQWAAELRRAWREAPPSSDSGANGAGDPPMKIAYSCADQALNVESVKIFCQIHFPAVYKRIQPFDGFDTIIRNMFQYCEERDVWGTFWQAIRSDCPAAYDRWFSAWQRSRNARR